MRLVRYGEGGRERPGLLDAAGTVVIRYLYGKGCKKDRKKAAHFYRLAAAQGVRAFGMSWMACD